MSPAPSIIVASYNQPNALRRVLTGLLHQELVPGEVIVADDGSDADTETLVAEIRAAATFPVEFTTTDDRGFRKAAALNRAIRMASGEHLMFLDGDCVPPSRWTVRYADALRRADFACAGVVYLDLDAARALSPQRIADGDLRGFCSAGRRLWFLGMHVRELLYRILRKPRKPRIKGGNWACRRDALVRVNGFDERFSGFGKEDSNVRNRLRNAGFRGHSLWHSNWVYHCSHELDPRRLADGVGRGEPDRHYVASQKSAARCANGLVPDPGAASAATSEES